MKSNVEAILFSPRERMWNEFATTEFLFSCARPLSSLYKSLLKYLLRVSVTFATRLRWRCFIVCSRLFVRFETGVFRFGAHMALVRRCLSTFFSYGVVWVTIVSVGALVIFAASHAFQTR